MSDGISELFTVILDWAISQGAERLDLQEGLWRADTDEWTVEINAHAEELEGVPPVSVRVTHKAQLNMAIIHPHGGVIGGGVSEDEMIAHFCAAAGNPTTQPIRPAPIQADSPSRDVPRPVQCEGAGVPVSERGSATLKDGAETSESVRTP